MVKIKIIIGSVRPNRFGAKAATWIENLAKEHTDATFEVVDLAEVNLPLLDEPQPPAMGNYVNEHTKKWAAIVDDADGFIFVSPEYNHGPAASLKNAIDFAAKEWFYKPAAFVSYGADAGGVRAVEQLRGTLAWLRMYDLSDVVMLPNYWTQLNEQGEFTATDAQNQDANRMLTNVAFWAEKMQPIRQELAAKS